MAIWGFTREMRDTMPFGLPPEELKPGKVIADPIQSDIGLTKLEVRVIDSPAFQRLRRVRQLGTTHLVYPAATHTRFSHSIGAVRAVQTLLDYAVAQRNGLHPVPDLFGQWATDETYYNEELARATVLARLGALLHDLCHIPFSHSIEDEMGILKPHDKNQWRLDELWKYLDADLRDLLASEDLETALKDVICPDLKIEHPTVREQYPFVLDVVGNTICADLVDYLARDHQFTGLPIALGQRFLSALFITPDGENEFNRRRMALSIVRDGRERADVVTELLKYLRYRYELTERVLAHHAKLRADAMIGKMLLLLRDEAAEQLLESDEAIRDKESARETAGRRIERGLLWRGDDGLLEYLSRMAEGSGPTPDRLVAVAQLARELLERRLFPKAGRCSATSAPAEQLREEYKEPRKRLKLERDLAQYAEVEPWKVAIWLPPREMGLKVAKVLVYDGSSVTQFNQYEANGRKRGSDLDDSHRALWAISVFVHESVSPQEREEILARLAQRSGIRWEEMRDDFGPDTERWPDELAARRVAEEIGPPATPEALLKEAEPVQARAKSDGPQTFAAVRAYFAEIGTSLYS